MPTQYELESQWTTAEGIAGVRYRYSDLVRIKAGDHAGETGEIITLLALTPEPTYGIVLPPNEKFVIVPEQNLEGIGSNAGGKLTLMPPGVPPGRH
jgi:hypothetical protein